MENIKVTYRRIDLLKPYEGNARVHSEAQIRQIAESIREFGFVNPVLIDRNNIVIAGHGRLIAAAQIGLDKVPTIQLGSLSERQRKALTIADNKIALGSTWDLEKLANELSELAESDFDLSLLGFDEQELDTLLKADAGVVPDWSGQLLAKDPEPEQSSERRTPQTRGASHDEYSLFELVMRKENKDRLMEVLNEVKSAKSFEKLEDTLIYIVNEFKGNQ